MIWIERFTLVSTGVEWFCPGPRSVPSTFGIGNPDITDVGNHVYSVAIQEGSDVPSLGHLPVWDTYLDEVT